MQSKSIPGRIAAALLVTMFTAASAGASTLDVIFFDNRFGSMNDDTGAYSPISTLPISKAAGIADSNGTLYVEDLADNLLTVDPVTGASKVLGNTGLGLNFVVFAGSASGLYGIDYASNLYSFDPEDGAAALIGKTGLPANNGGDDTSLSFDGSSLLYTAGQPGAPDELYRIDIATGLATNLGSTGVTGIAGSAFSNGVLELFQYGQSTNYLYSAADGSTAFGRGPALQTQILDGGVPAPSATQSTPAQVPEPVPFILAGSALTALGLFIRWRRPRREDVL